MLAHGSSPTLSSTPTHQYHCQNLTVTHSMKLLYNKRKQRQHGRKKRNNNNKRTDQQLDKRKRLLEKQARPWKRTKQAANRTRQEQRSTSEEASSTTMEMRITIALTMMAKPVNSVPINTTRTESIPITARGKGQMSEVAPKDILLRLDTPSMVHEIAAILRFGTSYELVVWLAKPSAIRVRTISSRTRLQNDSKGDAQSIGVRERTRNRKREP